MYEEDPVLSRCAASPSHGVRRPITSSQVMTSMYHTLGYKLHSMEHDALIVAAIAIDRQIMEGITQGIASFSDLCESPIEKLFVSALLYVCSGHKIPVALHNKSTCTIVNFSITRRQGDKTNVQYLHVKTQVEIDRYRADFLLSKSGKSVVVECDGEEFHSTPEQVTNDQKRGDVLLSLGYPTVRFTGAELYRDPFNCAAVAINSLPIIKPEIEAEFEY